MCNPHKKRLSTTRRRIPIGILFYFRILISKPLSFNDFAISTISHLKRIENETQKLRKATSQQTTIYPRHHELTSWHHNWRNTTQQTRHSPQIILPMQTYITILSPNMHLTYLAPRNSKKKKATYYQPKKANGIRAARASLSRKK